MDLERWTSHAQVSYSLDALTVEEREFLLDYVANNFVAAKAINRKHTAYGIKQRFCREHFYITQEQFTQAMQTVGYMSEPAGDGDAYFAISERSPHFSR